MDSSKNHLTVERKEGKTYKVVNEITEENVIYSALSSCLAHHYIYKSHWVKRVSDKPDYSTGNRIITVVMDYGYRYTFNVAL